MSVETIKRLSGGAFAARFGEADRPGVMARFGSAGSKILDKFFDWLNSPSPNIVAIELDPSERGSSSDVVTTRPGRYAFPWILL